LQLWGPITLCAYLRSRWSLKQSCSLRWELSNSMSHATFTQGNQGDSRLLLVGNQIANLTPDPSFGPNLCFRCPNGMCDLILDIYVPRVFQWYKFFFFNPLGCGPYNYSLKIWESTETPITKVEAPLGVWEFIPSHFSFTPGLPSWPATLQAFVLVISLRLGLWHIMCFHPSSICNITIVILYLHLVNLVFKLWINTIFTLLIVNNSYHERSWLMSFNLSFIFNTFEMIFILKPLYNDTFWISYLLNMPLSNQHTSLKSSLWVAFIIYILVTHFHFLLIGIPCTSFFLIMGKPLIVASILFLVSNPKYVPSPFFHNCSLHWLSPILASSLPKAQLKSYQIDFIMYHQPIGLSHCF